MGSLVPAHARGHPQGIADRDTLIGRAAKPRQVEVAGIVEAADHAIMERSTDERRRHRLGGREACPTALRAVPHTVELQRDLAVLQDQEPGRAAAGHEVTEAQRDVAHLKRPILERTGVPWERTHRIATPDDAVRPDLILVSEGRRLVLGRRGHDVRSRPIGLFIRRFARSHGLLPPLRRRWIARGRWRLQSKLSWLAVTFTEWHAHVPGHHGTSRLRSSAPGRLFPVPSVPTQRKGPRIAPRALVVPAVAEIRCWSAACNCRRRCSPWP